MPTRIAVLGAGRAGRARVRALENHPEASLAALIRRHPAPGEPDLSTVLADPSIDALIVCTPNLLHPPAARAGLFADKHVAVEFPLAPHASGARELFELARARSRVLHVEHIELLSSSQQQLRAAATGLGKPLGGSLQFTGASEGWIDDPTLAGPPALRAVARLHRVVDLFGEAEVAGASLLRGSRGGYQLSVELRFAAGGGLTLLEQRGPGLVRATEWDVHCEHGRLETPPEQPTGELFRSDLDHFLRRIRDAVPPYVTEQRILHVLSLVEAIERCAVAD